MPDETPEPTSSAADQTPEAAELAALRANQTLSAADQKPEAAELAALRAKLEANEQELNNYKLRLADFDNTRKRLLRDAEMERKYMTEAVIRDLLPALDNLDRALAAAKAAGDTGPLATGVSATVAQFLESLKRHGVTRIECAPGDVFDPNLHQAVMQESSAEFAPGQVIQVLQQGFRLHDRIIRPTAVVVAS